MIYPDIFGDFVEYSHEVLQSQRAPLGREEMRTILREEVQEGVRDVVLVMDTIVGSHVAPLREDLRGLRESVEGLKIGFQEVRVSLLDASAGEELSQLQELWTTRLGALETLVLSAKCDESLILKEMKKMELALNAKLVDLEVDPERVLEEVSKLKEEIVKMKQAGGEELNELLEELKRVVGGA
jgi:hypothetical protein